MPSQPNPSSATPLSASDRWCIEGALTIGTIADWHSRFAGRAVTATELELDLSGVTAADIFGLQLIYSMRRSAIDAGRTFKVTAIPPAIQAAATSSGIALTF